MEGVFYRESLTKYQNTCTTSKEKINFCPDFAFKVRMLSFYFIWRQLKFVRYLTVVVDQDISRPLYFVGQMLNQYFIRIISYLRCWRRSGCTTFLTPRKPWYPQIVWTWIWPPWWMTMMYNVLYRDTSFVCVIVTHSSTYQSVTGTSSTESSVKSAWWRANHLVLQLNSVKLKMNADTNVSLQNTEGSPKFCFSKKFFEKKENIKV